jgi:Na+-transporting methylmalonyl-CoA/oxaloacetate decarboxylase gamma subunit
MGLLVSFLLLSILYVAVSGVANLQVSYAAFDKENGPSAQKKAQ